METEINIKELLTGDLQRVHYVRRWGLCRVVYPETVASHSFSVALYAIVIGLWVNATAETAIANGVDVGKCAVRGLMHDLEEARTTDLPRPVKHGSPLLKAELDRLGRGEVEQMIAAVITCEDSAEWLRNQWDLSKSSKCREGAIVRFADFLATFAYILQEKGANPDFVKGYANTTPGQFREFNTAEFDFLRPLVRQAGEMVEATFEVKVL